MPKAKVFRPVGRGDDWHQNAVVERHGDHEIAMGFADTADLIVDHWLQKGPNDLLFEPLVFCHRHALELILKAAIRESAARLRANGLQDPKVDQADVDNWLAKDAGHNLHKLATRLDALLTRLGEKQLPPQTHSALISLHELDPTGETFRYAMVKAGNGTFVDAPRPLLSEPDDLQAHVDIVAMHEHFRSAFNLLSGGVMTVLENIADYQREMAHEAEW
jgi:hypothetical protein